MHMAAGSASHLVNTYFHVHPTPLLQQCLGNAPAADKSTPFDLNLFFSVLFSFSCIFFLTFFCLLLQHDDGVSWQSAEMLRSVTDGRQTPNGCPLTATLFAKIGNTSE